MRLSKIIYTLIIVFGLICGGLFFHNLKTFTNLVLGQSDKAVDVEGADIRLDYNAVDQKIEGFGASGAWWAQDVGGWDNLSDIMDLLYDRKKGIGLNIYQIQYRGW